MSGTSSKSRGGEAGQPLPGTRSVAGSRAPAAGRRSPAPGRVSEAGPWLPLLSVKGRPLAGEDRIWHSPQPRGRPAAARSRTLPGVLSPREICYGGKVACPGLLRAPSVAAHTQTRAVTAADTAADHRLGAAAGSSSGWLDALLQARRRPRGSLGEGPLSGGFPWQIS